MYCQVHKEETEMDFGEYIACQSLFFHINSTVALSVGYFSPHLTFKDVEALGVYAFQNHSVVYVTVCCVSELVSYPGVSASKACTFHGQTVSPH